MTCREPGNTSHDGLMKNVKQEYHGIQSSFSHKHENLKTSALNRRDKYKFGVSFKYAQAFNGGVAIDYYLCPKINVEMYFVPFLCQGGSLGFDYHFKGDNPDKTFTFYWGFHAGFYFLDFFSKGRYLLLASPIGVEYISRSGFFLSGELGLNLMLDIIDIYPLGGPIPGFSIGKRF